MGPGLNPQYTGAPKAGGGCGLLDKSTTTSPMAQPQCSKKQCINVNMVAEQFRSTARLAVRSVGAVSLESHEVEVETVATIVKEVIVKRSWE